MPFSVKEIEDLLNGADDEGLYKAADIAKTKVYGHTVFLRGIIENSNICSRNCSYCGIRKPNLALSRYKLTENEILECAAEIDRQGLKSIVIQSGESDTTTPAEIASIVSKIKELTGSDITLSLGEKPRDVYKMWKEAGADRYLLKVETLQPELYRSLHPGYELLPRVRCVEALRDLGYQVGSGFISDLPGYTTKMFAEDLLELSKIGVHMFSLTPFVQAKNTPLEHHPNGRMDLVYRAMAVYRLMAPATNIPVASACASLDPACKPTGLKRGANVLMLSYTPDKCRKDYALYQGKNVAYSEKLTDLENLVHMIEDIGLKPGLKNAGRSVYKVNEDAKNSKWNAKENSICGSNKCG